VIAIAPPTDAASVDIGPRQTLTILAPDVAQALMPVLTVLRRRQCRITRVSFEEGGTVATGHLCVEVACPPRHAHCVAAWVANIVGVQDVKVCRHGV
jgi:hypothetical protein